MAPTFRNSTLESVNDGEPWGVTPGAAGPEVGELHAVGADDDAFEFVEISPAVESTFTTSCSDKWETHSSQADGPHANVASSHRKGKLPVPLYSVRQGW